VLARDPGADEPSPIRPRAQPDPHGKPGRDRADPLIRSYSSLYKIQW
jgi:hypothetical protein